MTKVAGLRDVSKGTQKRICKPQPERGTGLQPVGKFFGLAIQERAELIRFGFGHRFHAGADSLLVDLLPTDVIERDGIGGEIHRVMVPHKLRTRAGAAVIKAFDAIQYVQDGFVADDRHGHNRGNERATGIERAAGMRAAHVVHQAMRKILQRQRHAG